mmetsp:Transcript_27544/g.88969  ORF Transcript_27544/g.88969 Transcript_27544/m.88969 type:complete len:213 (-) Transcript_27544:498-1136(-)
MLVVPSEARAKEVSEFRQLKAEVEARASVAPRRGQRRRTSKLVPALLKADSAGSLEAVAAGLSHFPTSRVELKMVKAAVGPITESDVQLAKSVGAAVFGFNVPVASAATTLAAQLQVATLGAAPRPPPTARLVACSTNGSLTARHVGFRAFACAPCSPSRGVGTGPPIVHRGPPPRPLTPLPGHLLVADCRAPAQRDLRPDGGGKADARGRH